MIHIHLQHEITFQHELIYTPSALYMKVNSSSLLALGVF